MESKLMFVGKVVKWWGRYDRYSISVKTDNLSRSATLFLCPEYVYHKLLNQDGMDYQTWCVKFFNKQTYAWGYQGVGPDMLSLCILRLYAGQSLGADAAHNYIDHSGEKLGEGFAEQHYKAFTADVVSKLPPTWTLTYEDITAWLKGKGIKCS